ncbi:MFS transporter [Streptomyces sp. NPDC088725]|uniref:MFS transporter n=1 Tax=Streptomyces sp. NPDC088725 TaxID=3365873 RepID=UPI00382304A5
MRAATAFLYALTCGVAVSTVYLPQPLLGLVSDDLRIGVGSAGTLATAVQLGYALGILLLVPLGDRMRPRRLVTVLLVSTALLLALASTATSTAVLAPLLVVAGVTAVVPQVLIPLAGRLVPRERSGAVVGVLMTGLVCGIFGSRVVAGLVGQAVGWRSVLLVFAALSLLVAVALFRVLPDGFPPPAPSYSRLLAGLPRLVRAQPALRQAAWIQFFVFGAFNATWTVLTLQLTGQFGWSTGQAGLFGLVGLAGGLLTPAAGAQVDRRGPLAVLGVCLALVAVSVVLIALGGGTLVVLALGMFVLTVGTQCAQVAHQTRIFAAVPEARSSVNTVYMSAAFLGGSLGAQLGTAAFTHSGLAGVAGTDTGLVCLAVLGYGAARHRARTRTAL